MLIKRIIFLLTIVFVVNAAVISQHEYTCSSDTECREEEEALYCLILCQR
jgi:hypothetical protein